MSKIDKDFFRDYFKFDKLDKNINYVKFFSPVDFKERELIYEFAIYHPFKNSKTQQISIKGSSFLYELKDKVYCVLDEIQTNTNSSFFFIENTFYNDLRDDNKTLSNKILENKLKKLDVNSYKILNDNDRIKVKEENKFEHDKMFYCSRNIYLSEIYEEASMGEKRIEEIPMRIGYPYLFRHIDHCDHMIMITDIKLGDRFDNFTDGENSMVTYQKKLKRRLCDACAFYYAKFISINDKIAGENSKISFFCEYCLKKLHEKDVKDNTRNNLKLIPYFHD